MDLGEPDLTSNLSLAQVFVVAQMEDAPLTFAERAQADLEEEPIVGVVEAWGEPALMIEDVRPGREGGRHARPLRSNRLGDIRLADARLACELGDRRRSAQARSQSLPGGP
ncbi:MAG TPA: hypothetical protein VHI53_06590 [Gaiellaceae bacterium]|nr:hypothetical protein [Gaiellaceae bacterium]